MRKLLLALALLAMLASSCGDSASRIHGVWISGLERLPITFAEDGTWSVPSAAGSESLKDAGEFSFDGEVMTIESEPGFFCRSYGQATYEFTFVDDDTIEVEVVEDECGPRRADWSAGFTRQAP